MSRLSTFVARATLAATAFTMSTGALAGGDPLADLSARWWQWSGSIPLAVNPILDPDGQDCMVGQNGSVWFLAGTSGSTASRTCSLPEGVPLFFPLVNSVNFDSPGVCGQTDRLSVAELRAFSASFIDGITSYGATLDGHGVASVRRVTSVVFPLTLPADNFFSFPGCVVPAGVYPRSVDDGYYGLIAYLKPGAHTLQIAAANASGFNVNVSWQLNVVHRALHRP